MRAQIRSEETDPCGHLVPTKPSVHAPAHVRILVQIRFCATTPTVSTQNNRDCRFCARPQNEAQFRTKMGPGPRCDLNIRTFGTEGLVHGMVVCSGRSVGSKQVNSRNVQPHASQAQPWRCINLKACTVVLDKCTESFARHKLCIDLNLVSARRCGNCVMFVPKRPPPTEFASTLFSVEYQSLFPNTSDHKVCTCHANIVCNRRVNSPDIHTSFLCDMTNDKLAPKNFFDPSPSSLGFLCGLHISTVHKQMRIVVLCLFPKNTGERDLPVLDCWT